MPRNWRAAQRFVILYFSESVAWSSITGLVAASGYDLEIESTYRSIRIPSLRRYRSGSAEDYVNPRESRQALISSCHSPGACLRL